MTTDPRLTPTERDALARLLVGTRKGGEGWLDTLSPSCYKGVTAQ